MEFSRQEYWSGLPYPPPGDLPNPGIKPACLMYSALADGFFTTSATWEAPAENVGVVLNVQCPRATARSYWSRVGFPHSSVSKELPTMWEIHVWILGQDDPLEKGMAVHSSILAWRIPWMEKPGGLHSMEVQKVDMTEWLTHTKELVTLTERILFHP